MSARARLVQELRALLCQSLGLRAPDPELSADEPLFSGRLPLDSVDSLQWVSAIERHYQCTLPDRDITSGALESLGAMADTLLRQRATRNRDVF